MRDLNYSYDDQKRIVDTSGKLVKNLEGRKGYEMLEKVNNLNVWEQVMELGKKDKRHVDVANNLTDDEIETVMATLDYFQGSSSAVMFDLKVARYRVFDWLAMAVQGRIENEVAVKVLAYSFLKVEGDIDRWIQDLRETDYDIDESYSKLNLGRNS